MPSPRTAIAALLAGALLPGCAPEAPNPIGDPGEGAIEIARAACGSCHVIPGIPLADGRVGPSLAGFGGQRLIAGTLSNSPANLVLWLRNPRQVRPHGTMPDMGLSDRQARDVAAYLSGLR